MNEEIIRNASKCDIFILCILFDELLLSDILGTDPDVTSRKLEDEVDMRLLKEAIKS